MIRYTEWLEQNNVYRIDQDKIGNFSSKLRSYHRNSDWTSSGTFDKERPSKVTYITFCYFIEI